MNTRFYVLVRVLEPETMHETRYIQPDPYNTGNVAPCCLTCSKPIGQLPWLPPYRIKLETWGNDFGDIAYGSGAAFLASERFVAHWREEGLIGLSGFEPVEIVKAVRHKRFKGDPPKYFRVDVAQSRAAIDMAASGAIMDDDSPICPDCRLASGVKSMKRLVLEAFPVPMEDIFIARGLPGTIVVSERFKVFCEKHKILNAVLIPANDYSFSYP